jgi:hypothetical protein
MLLGATHSAPAALEFNSKDFIVIEASYKDIEYDYFVRVNI